MTMRKMPGEKRGDIMCKRRLLDASFHRRTATMTLCKREPMWGGLLFSTRGGNERIGDLTRNLPG